MVTRTGAVVIGGGIAGVSAAYELAAHMHVVLLEQEAQLARHTTGRSAAAYLETYGSLTVRRLTVASRSFLASMLSPRPLLWIGAADRAEALAAAADLGRALVPSVRLIDFAEAASMCPALRSTQAEIAVLEPDAMDIDVAAVHQTFVQGMRARGGEIRRSAPVASLARTGTTWVVTTPLEVYEAEVVVNAAGAWCDEIAALAGVPPIGLHALRRTAFTCPAPEGVDVRSWPLVADIDDRFYFKPEGPQLLCSLADETPSPPCDAVAEPVDVALAIERINDATTLGLRHVRRAWAGLRSFVADRTPVVGVDSEAPGFCWLAGQGGYGIQTAPAMARAAAGLVVDRRLPDDLIALGITVDDVSPARCR
ncbi:MAG: D-arginine dehydrogenase [Acidimicrobiaceae bacterium]